jgi:hypothetical protein
MDDILDIIKDANSSSKNKRFAFITMILVLLLLLIKFIFFYNTFLMIDSPLIPEYTLSFALQDSFLSGIIMSFGSLFSFILYNYKKHTVSFIINSLLIINHFIFPYFYYSIVSNTL